MASTEVYTLSEKGNHTFAPPSNPTMPDQLGLRTADWYINNLFYICQFYNTPTRNVNLPLMGGIWNDWFSSEDDATEFWGQPVNRMLLQLMYVTGQQPNLNFNHLTQNVTNTNFLAYWTKGKKTQVNIEQMMGSALAELSGIKIGADPLSPKAKSRKDKAKDREMLIYLLKPIIDKQLKGMVELPPNAQKFDSMEAIKDWMEIGFKDQLADIYVDIALNEWQKQYWIDEALFILKYGAATGVAGVEHIMENGQMKKIVHPPYNLIIDNRLDDDFNRKARFVGVIEPLTLMQILNRYPQLSMAQQEELSKIASSESMVNSFNAANTNFSWWGSYQSGTPYFKDPSITVVRAYWIAPERIGGQIVETVYTAEIIGNKYMVNFGPANNVVEDPVQPYKVKLPIMIWTPGMTMGIYNSFVSRIMDLQNQDDAIRFKIMEHIGRSKGKVYYVNAERLNSSVDVAKMMNDWSQMGITVLGASGESDNYVDGQKPVETVDMTMDPNVFKLMEVRKEITAEMDSFVSQTKLSLGQQTKYVGQKQFSGSIEQSALGTATFYAGFMNFIQMNLRYELNVKKNLYADGQLEEEAETVVGQRGLKFLKLTKDKFAEDYLIYLKLDDTIDEEDKKMLLELAKATLNSPNMGGMTIWDYLKLTDSKTKSALKDHFKARAKEIEEKQQQALQMKFKAEQDKIKQGQDHEFKLKALHESGMTTRKQMDVEVKKEKIAKDAGVTPPDIPVSLPPSNSENIEPQLQEQLSKQPDNQ